MPEGITVLLLFSLPLIVFPFGFSPFEIPKVITAEIGIEVLLILALFSKKRLFWPSKIQMILLLGIALLGLIHLFLLRTPTSFFGNPFRLQGIFLLWHLLIFSLLSSPLKFNKTFTKVCFFPFILLILSAFFLGPNESGRSVGTLGEPNALAASIIFFWPILFLSPNKTFKIFGFLGTIIIIIVSASRSGLLAFITQLVFIFLRKPLKFPSIISLVPSLLVIIFGFFLPFLEKGIVFEKRAEVWQTAFLAGLQRPLIGGGFGNTSQLLHQTALRLNNPLQYQFVDSAHNLILDWWVQGGLAGTFLLISLIFFSFRIFLAQSKDLEIALILGVLTVMFFNPVSVVTLLAFWWLLGLGSKKI